MENKFCKFYKWQKYVSYNNGVTWSPLNEYEKGDLYESLSVDCGGGSIIYRWVSIDEYTCEEVQDKYTYNFSNGDGIVIACGEGNVNINNEYSGSGNFKMPGGGALGHNATSTCDGVTSTTVHNCVSNVPYQYAWAFGALEEATIEDGITSIDKEAFADCISLTKVSMPNTIETIDEFAFSYCYSLKNITLSENLKTLKKGAFMSTSLSAITIPSQVKKIGYAAGDDSHIVANAAYGGSLNRYEGVFMNTDLVTVTLNEGLEIIGARTFNGCKLREFTAPSTLKVLGYEGAGYTLSGDSTSPTYRYSNSEIGVLNCTSLSSVTLNEGLEIIGNNAFSGCRSLTSVTIPSTVKAMYMNVFEGCSSLRYIISLPTIPPPIYKFRSTSDFQPFGSTNNCLIYVPDESVDAYKSASVWSDVKKRIVPLSSFNPSLGNKFEATYTDGTTYDVLCNDAEEELTQTVVRMRSDYKNMLSSRIGHCVTSIGSSAFWDCTSLTSVTIPDSVTSIGQSAFAGCTNLTSVTIPNSVTSIGELAFSDCTKLTSVTIPNSVTSIGSSAFQSCHGLTSIKIPDSVTAISNNAFAWCTGLTSCTIGSGVTSIGSSAFYNCRSLKNITIRNSITSIGGSAFNYCDGLESITINATTPPSINYDTFTNTNNCPIYVPAASVDAYKAAWSSYASRIRPLN